MVVAACGRLDFAPISDGGVSPIDGMTIDGATDRPNRAFVTPKM